MCAMPAEADSKLMQRTILNFEGGGGLTKNAIQRLSTSAKIVIKMYCAIRSINQQWHYLHNGPLCMCLEITATALPSSAATVPQLYPPYKNTQIIQ